MGTSDIKDELLYGLSREVVERWRPRPVKKLLYSKREQPFSQKLSEEEYITVPSDWDSLSSVELIDLLQRNGCNEQILLQRLKSSNASRKRKRTLSPVVFPDNWDALDPLKLLSNLKMNNVGKELSPTLVNVIQHSKDQKRFKSSNAS